VSLDNETKLYWQSRPTTKKFSWRDAIKYCRNLNYGGYSDWRLPNIDELKSLVDYNRYNPAIATTLIDIKTDDWYWSSSEDISDSSGSWLSFSKMVVIIGLVSLIRVVCVCR